MSKKNIFFIYIFLLLLGSLSSFSLPPYNFILINFITYSFFLYSIILFKEKKLKIFNFFFLGFTFGYGYFASSLYWVSHSLTFDRQLTFLIPIAILGLPILLALFYGLAVLVIHSFVKRNYIFLLIFSISLSVFEYLRGILFTGFSWNLISYSWSFSLENIQMLKFIGTYTFFLYSIILFKEKKLKIINFFFLGFTFGYGYFASSLYWVAHSLTFDRQLTFLIPIAILGLPILLALFYGLAVLVIHSFVKRNYIFLLIFSISLSVFEYLRGILFTGFSWNLISYSWSFSLENIQMLKFIGTYTFNFFSILIFSIYFNSLWPVQFKKILINSFFLFFILISNYLFGKITIKNTEFIHYNDVKIKIVQPNINIAKTWGIENEKRNLSLLLSLSKVNKDEKTLIVWPEGMIQQTNPKDLYKYKEYFNKNFSKNHLIIVGVTNPSITGNKINFYNSLVVLNNNAEVVNIYNKIKLVPFGEFIPFENLLTKWGLKKITFGYSSFSSGNDRKEIKVFNNLSFLPLLCYEIIYSGELKRNSKDYNFIINISEDGWFGDSIGPYQHLAQAVFRAVEQGVPIVRSTNTGVSAFILPNGKIINSLELNKSGFIDLKLSFLNGKTLFSVFENYIFYFTIFLSVIFVIALRRINKNG